MCTIFAFSYIHYKRIGFYDRIKKREKTVISMGSLVLSNKQDFLYRCPRYRTQNHHDHWLYLLHSFGKTSSTARAREMKMAALNILSQPWPPAPSLSVSNCYYSFCNTSKSISSNKSHSLSHSYHFSLLSSLYGSNRPNPSSKLSAMPTHFSKSGNFSISRYNFIYFSIYFAYYSMWIWFLLHTYYLAFDNCLGRVGIWLK